MAGGDGFLLLDKTPGPTSFHVVDRARAALRRQRGAAGVKCGHAGSLDPIATGLLILLVGAGTRLAPFLMGLDKSYRVRVRFGAGTDTLDAEGRVTERGPVAFGPDAVAAALAGLRGEQQQVPPAYSALKREGQRMYRLARAGKPLPDLAPRAVVISRLEMVETHWAIAAPDSASADALAGAGAEPQAVELPLAPNGLAYDADLLVECSSGTYVRALARDLAAALGTAGHVRELRRLRVGAFKVEDALPGDRMSDGAALEAALRPLGEALPHLPALVLTPEEVKAIRQGGQPLPSWLSRLPQRPLAERHGAEAHFQMRGPGGDLVAVGRVPAAGGAPRSAAVFGVGG